jgi:hypothetical protein
VSARRRFGIVVVASLGPAAWAVHLAVVYALVPFACQRSSTLVLHLMTFGPLFVALVPVFATRPVLEGPLWGSEAGAGAWQVRGRDGAVAAPASFELVRRLGVWMGAMFALVIALGGLSVELVGACR